MQQFFEYSEEVAQAIQERKPILALESTVITHGLPFPENINLALELENIVRQHDVVPATIAILKGKIKIGLSLTELKELVHDKQVAKASRRDLAYVIAKGLSAGTTVAATMYCADIAGIKVFATGGIGGVHRGDEQDISADLIELARTPLAVVCAGAKAILDLSKTLEYLETHSVPVIGYKTDTFPAFYSSKSQYKLSARCDELTDLAKLLKIHWQLGMHSGVLIANPIPSENEIAAEEIEPAIAEALTQAEEERISGKEVTPYLLAKVAKVTEGKSIEANLHLIKNNVRVGAILAQKINII